MRYLVVLCLFFVIACNNAGTKKSESAIKSAVVENVKTVAVELTIKGMTCTGCEQTIQSGISSLQGVKQVKATYKNGKAYVEYNPANADTTMMKQKVTASGYIVAGIKTISMDSLRSKL